MDRLAALQAIAADAQRGELVFPTNLEAALKIQQAFSDSDCDLNQASRLVLSEPLIAARIVAVANSVAYKRNGQEITDVRSAMLRLGQRTLYALATAVVTRQFAAMIVDPEVRAKATQLWEHTAHVSALAYFIAKKITFKDPDTVMFAAIVHEVGGFYLLSRVHEYPGLLDCEFTEWLDYGEQAIGRAVLKRLAVPEVVLEAVEELWQGFLSIPPNSLGDTLLLANHLAHVESPLSQLFSPTAEHASPIFDYAIGEETLSSILEEAAVEIQSLTAALRF